MDEPEHLESVRQPWTLVIVYTVFYAAIFIVGLVGNVFVVLAVLLNTNLRSVTDYLISSLALADLLIIIFCLPTTLLNNLLTEWQLGSVGCKLSTFINSTTSCASIFTLVAVTADRYVAICHTLKYTLWETRSVVFLIVFIWFVSAVLASPNLILYDEILYDLIPPNGTLVARLCVSIQDDFLHFIIVNLIIAFLLPVIMICVSYALIFITVTNHQSLAVDARIRDERIKLRVAQMMLTVIVVFMMCWTPLYALYFYFFMASNRQSTFFQIATSVLRPIFQWLSLLSSSLNPLIYIAYSQKYRRAFHQLLLMPCRLRYQSLRRATRATFRLAPLKSDEAMMAASIAASDIGGGTGYYSSYTSPTMISGRTRKVSLPQNAHYYYHYPSNHNSHSTCPSTRMTSLSMTTVNGLTKSRKLSDQSTCRSSIGSRCATFTSRHNEALLMCDSKITSRQSVGMPMLNFIDKARKNAVCNYHTPAKLTSTKSTFCDINNNNENISNDNSMTTTSNHRNSSITTEKSVQVNSSESARSSALLMVELNGEMPISQRPISDITDKDVLFLKSPLKFFQNLMQRQRKVPSLTKYGAISSGTSTTSHRCRVISVMPKLQLSDGDADDHPITNGNTRHHSGEVNNLPGNNVVTVDKIEPTDIPEPSIQEKMPLQLLPVPPPKPERSPLLLAVNYMFDNTVDIEFADENDSSENYSRNNFEIIKNDQSSSRASIEWPVPSIKKNNLSLCARQTFSPNSTITMKITATNGTETTSEFNNAEDSLLLPNDDQEINNSESRSDIEDVTCSESQKLQIRANTTTILSPTLMPLPIDDNTTASPRSIENKRLIRLSPVVVRI